MPKLYPLKINNYTTILVPKEKCNEEYRQTYISRRNAPTSLSMPGKVNPHPSEAELKELAKQGMSVKQASEHLGYKPSTVLYYNKKYKAGLIKTSNNKKD